MECGGSVGFPPWRAVPELARCLLSPAVSLPLPCRGSAATHEPPRPTPDPDRGWPARHGGGECPVLVFHLGTPVRTERPVRHSSYGEPGLSRGRSLRALRFGLDFATPKSVPGRSPRPGDIDRISRLLDSRRFRGSVGGDLRRPCVPDGRLGRCPVGRLLPARGNGSIGPVTSGLR